MKKLILIFLILLLFLDVCFAIEEEITLPKNAEFELKFDEPKKVLFQKSYINEFSPVLNFRGVYDVDIKEERSNFTYPFILEGGGEIKFDESKNKIKIVSNFTRNVDDLDNKFLGKLSDVYFERQINNNHKIVIGNSRLPFGIEGSKSTYNLMFSKRAQIGDNFNDARALGVKYTGNYNGFSYCAGGFSSTRYLQDVTDGAEFAGWLSYKPFYEKNHIFKDLKIGAGTNVGAAGSGYSVFGSGLEWEYDKFLFNIEYAYADGSNSLEYNPNKQEGFYSTFVYDLNEKLQLALRYDIFDYNTKQPDTTVQKYTVGLNYYVFKQRFRFGLDYTYTLNPGLNNDSNSINFLTQIML